MPGAPSKNNAHYEKLSVRKHEEKSFLKYQKAQKDAAARKIQQSRTAEIRKMHDSHASRHHGFHFGGHHSVHQNPTGKQTMVRRGLSAKETPPAGPADGGLDILVGLIYRIHEQHYAQNAEQMISRDLLANRKEVDRVVDSQGGVLVELYTKRVAYEGYFAPEYMGIAIVGGGHSYRDAVATRNSKLNPQVKSLNKCSAENSTGLEKCTLSDNGGWIGNFFIRDVVCTPHNPSGDPGAVMKPESDTNLGYASQLTQKIRDIRALNPTNQSEIKFGTAVGPIQPKAYYETDLRFVPGSQWTEIKASR